jgi:hypothetical protein
MDSYFWWNLLKALTISLLIILFIHYIWGVIDNNSTKKSTKSLIENQTEKYKKIINELTMYKDPLLPLLNHPQMTEIEKQNMINELNNMVLQQ